MLDVGDQRRQRPPGRARGRRRSGCTPRRRRSIARPNPARYAAPRPGFAGRSRTSTPPSSSRQALAASSAVPSGLPSSTTSDPERRASARGSGADEPLDVVRLVVRRDDHGHASTATDSRAVRPSRHAARGEPRPLACRTVRARPSRRDRCRRCPRPHGPDRRVRRRSCLGGLAGRSSATASSSSSATATAACRRASASSSAPSSPPAG